MPAPNPDDCGGYEAKTNLTPIKSSPTLKIQEAHPEYYHDGSENYERPIIFPALFGHLFILVMLNRVAFAVIGHVSNIGVGKWVCPHWSESASSKRSYPAR